MIHPTPPAVNGLIPPSPALLDVRPRNPVNISCTNRRKNKVQWQKEKERRYESAATFYSFSTFFSFFLFLFFFEGFMHIKGICGMFAWSRRPSV